MERVYACVMGSYILTSLYFRQGEKRREQKGEGGGAGGVPDLLFVDAEGHF